MASLGRITNAIVAASNENTLQLAGFNVNFSLLKVEAPKEFMGLGAVLSRKRKMNAEDGPLHRTARKLGALFEQIVPSTPSLIRAYGKRATAIFQTPGINPQGTRKEGPFESFVGADGGSLWAAATSGQPAVAVYLLACMLARRWNAQVATSIWVELVEERKQEIETAFKEGNVASMTVILAAGQDISREELDLWDDSARAWLQSADAAKLSEQKQLELILKNVVAPISSGTKPYTNVISAWKQAMVGLEQILLGIPQQISDGSVLLAISAWHIFPDLLVLGSKTVNVKFGDSLVPGGGVITIGLQSTDIDQGRIKWSLALSHLRYYGDPVEVTSGDTKSRVSMNQLHLAAFGSVMASWGAPIEETIPLATWFVTLWAKLQEAPDEVISFFCKGRTLREHLSWLCVLVGAAEQLMNYKGEELDLAIMVVGFGHRRGGYFLGTLERPLPTFFGLCNRLILHALQKKTNVDRGIDYLRELSKMAGYGDGDAFISFQEKGRDEKEKDGQPLHQEYATAVPHSSSAQKRDSDGEMKLAQNLWRSFNFSTKDDDACDCDGECGPTCPCVNDRPFCTWNCHGGSSFDIRNISCQHSSTAFNNRAAEIFSQGELCGTYGRSLHGPFQESQIPPRFVMEWDDPPLLFSHLPKTRCTPNLKPRSATSFVKQPCCCYDPCHLHTEPNSSTSDSDEPEVYPSVLFDLGSSNKSSSFSLWVKRDREGESHPKLYFRPRPAELLVKIDGATAVIPSLDPSGLLEYIHTIAGHETQPDSAMGLLLETTSPLEPVFLKALSTLSVASHLYKDLEGATVPLSIMSSDLSSARWMGQSASPRGSFPRPDHVRNEFGTLMAPISRTQASLAF